jgi:SAM-dependent methyltransferase
VVSPAERALSFGAVARDYDRLRPGPPSPAVDWLLPQRRQVVVDLAAGTGLLTRAVAGKAGHVVAVEPDERMRAVLAARSPEVEVLAGRGEAIPLPDASADAVFVSSAWHWLDPDLAVPEIARVLRDGGRFGLIWTGRDRSTEWLRADEWFPELAARPDSGQDYGWGGADLLGSGDRRQVRLPDPAMFVNIETSTFRFSRPMPIADVADMLTTYSRVITASAEVRAAGRARAAAALAARFDGAATIDVPMRSRCWRADRVSRADA